MIEESSLTYSPQEGWAVASVFRILDGAVLTTCAGDAGFAGAMELTDELRIPANDESWPPGC